MGEFIKQCMESAAEILCASQKHLFSKVSLSGVTAARRIDELEEDIENTLKEHLYYSLVVDESCNINDTGQLDIFIRGTDQQINVTEELVAIKCTTKGYDIANAVLSTLERYNLKLEAHCGFVTDAAAAVVAKNEGVAAQIRKEASLFENKEFLQCHCILHQKSCVRKALA